MGKQEYQVWKGKREGGGGGEGYRTGKNMYFFLAPELLLSQDDAYPPTRCSDFRLFGALHERLALMLLRFVLVTLLILRTNVCDLHSEM